MRLFLTILATLFFWGLVLTKFNRMWRRRRETSQAYLGSVFWLITLLLGLSMTLHIDPVQTAVGTLTGLANFGWYLAYMIGIIGFYLVGFLGTQANGAYGERSPFLLKTLLVTTMLLFTWLYSGWLRLGPEWPARSPRGWPEMLFLVGFFGYACLAEAYSFGPLQEALRRQREPLLRIRTLLGLATAVIAEFFCALKISYAVLGYLYPDWSVVEIINQMALFSMAGVAAFLVPLLISHRTYMRIYEFLSLHKKLRLMADLSYLQKQLQRHCPTILWQEPTWWERVTRPDFYIYRAAVSILDSERILSGYLERMDRSGQVTTFVADKTGTMRYWDPKSVQAARQLQNRMGIPQDANYAQILQHLRHVSIALRTE